MEEITTKCFFALCVRALPPGHLGNQVLCDHDILLRS